MEPSALAATFRNLLISVAVRVNGSRRSPVPFQGVRQQIAGLLQTPIGAVLLALIAVAFVVHGVRSAWRESYRRWYRR
jgi:succinate dehydrogenase/fumarate reductase cytochrome b subunit